MNDRPPSGDVHSAGEFDDPSSSFDDVNCLFVCFLPVIFYNFINIIPILIKHLRLFSEIQYIISVLSQLAFQSSTAAINGSIRNNAKCFCFVLYARTYVVVTHIFGDLSRRINYENYIYSFLLPIKVNKPYSASQMMPTNLSYFTSLSLSKY